MVRIEGTPPGRKGSPHDTQSESRPVPQTYDKNEACAVCRNSLPMWKDTTGSHGISGVPTLFSRFLFRYAASGFALSNFEPSASFPLIIEQERSPQAKGRGRSRNPESDDEVEFASHFEMSEAFCISTRVSATATVAVAATLCEMLYQLTKWNVDAHQVRILRTNSISIGNRPHFSPHVDPNKPPSPACEFCSLASKFATVVSFNHRERTRHFTLGHAPCL